MNTDTQAQAHARMDAVFAANAPEPNYVPPTYVYNKHIRQRRYEGPVKPRT